MKKNFLLLYIFACFFLFASCSDNTEESTQPADFETLKSEAEFINSKITWTEETESGRLLEKIKNPEGIDGKVKASVLTVAAIKNEEPLFIFPSLAGFGSLDTSLIPLNLKSEVEKFCDSFSKNDDLSPLFREESLYNLALFYYDLSSRLPNYEKFFNESENKNFFDSYKLGEPFIDGVNYNIPIRFVFKNKILILETYWSLENSKWLLDQIQISTIYDKNSVKNSEDSK